MNRLLFSAIVLLVVGATVNAVEYQSRYRLPNGATINAFISIEGNGGSYALDDGSIGNLFDITSTPMGGNTKVRGRWQLGGESGSFEWNVIQNGAQFLGNWRGDFGGSGVWNGSRVGGGNGGPVPPPKRPRP